MRLAPNVRRCSRIYYSQQKFLGSLLTQDDTEQFEIARDVINSCSATRPAFICRKILVELVSAAEMRVEIAHDDADILPLYKKHGFGFSDLMICQTAI